MFHCRRHYVNLQSRAFTNAPISSTMLPFYPIGGGLRRESQNGKRVRRNLSRLGLCGECPRVADRARTSRGFREGFSARIFTRCQKAGLTLATTAAVIDTASHLGRAGLLLAEGRPGKEAYVAVWRSWDGKSISEQVAEQRSKPHRHNRVFVGRDSLLSESFVAA